MELLGLCLNVINAGLFEVDYLLESISFWEGFLKPPKTVV